MITHKKSHFFLTKKGICKKKAKRAKTAGAAFDQSCSSCSEWHLASCKLEAILLINIFKYHLFPIFSQLFLCNFRSQPFQYVNVRCRSSLGFLWNQAEFRSAWCHNCSCRLFIRIIENFDFRSQTNCRAQVSNSCIDLIWQSSIGCLEAQRPFIITFTTGQLRNSGGKSC